ncbi:SDR family oxidoreductase [Streptomonospora salina]|uniref:NAD(P)H dehydrogenase (Quinone) n=1 Tax=Streptomonospora salina TaxID=104205 RepID=A0A841EFS8_9ACTN|nr:SDR family oxidoreductase [Streptomonospora salina]MBB5999738.1 NAD(P)H dehydrogenase (quinone) [Streptomonospora salina]
MLVILVTGATGQLGSAVIDRLLERTDPAGVAALVRDPDKAAGIAARGVSVRVGDYDDPDALDRAMQGVDRVLLIAGTAPQARVQQHRNVIDAAQRAGVSLIGFAGRSMQNADASQTPLMGDYFATEDRIRSSGLPHALFRNGLYMDTVPLYVGGAGVFENGLRVPVGEGRVAYALRREMGEAIANAMLDHGGENRTYVVAAPVTYGFDDVAAALGEVSGRPLSYIRVTEEEYIAGAVRSGTPEEVANNVLGFYRDIRDNRLDETSGDLELLLGRRPAGLVEGLRELFSLPESTSPAP